MSERSRRGESAQASRRARARGRSPGAGSSRNRIAMAMLGLFVLIVVLCLAAPLYAHHVAHTDPFASNLNGTTIVDGKHVAGDAAGRRAASASA